MIWFRFECSEPTRAAHSPQLDNQNLGRSTYQSLQSTTSDQYSTRNRDHLVSLCTQWSDRDLVVISVSSHARSADDQPNSNRSKLYQVLVGLVTILSHETTRTFASISYDC